MPYNPEKHHRRSIRLKDYDYSTPGAYFITICTHQRECLLGEVLNGEMQLNQLGQLASAHWQRLPHHFPTVELDAFVVMPNHVHGILILTNPRRGAALGQHISPATTDDQPNATPISQSSATTDDQPNATPISQSPEIADVLQPEQGVAFGAKTVGDCHVLQPNAAPLQSGSLGAILLNFKSVTTRRINQIRQMAGVPVWQRNYYEHIIWDETALHKIRDYIQTNPLLWQIDKLHPNHPWK
jgi:REP element-mobilizing transposase RayT